MFTFDGHSCRWPRRTSSGPRRAWSWRHAHLALRLAGGLVLLLIAVTDPSSKTGGLAVAPVVVVLLGTWTLLVAVSVLRYPWRRIRNIVGVSDIAYVWVLVATTGGAESITRLTGFAIITAWAIGYERGTLVALTILLTGGIITIVAIDSETLISSSQIACAAGALWVIPAAILSSTLRDRSALRTSAAIADRRELTLELAYVESRTRTQTADTLHDHALQLVLTARQDLTEVHDRTNDPQVKASINHLIDASRAMRELINELAETTIDENLEDALELATRPLAQRAGFRLDIEITSDTTEAHQRLLVPMARELVANAAKHADATRVHVRVDHHDDGMTALRVTDDGRGIAPDRLVAARRSGHHGIAALHRRVRGLGGHMHIESTPLQGTTVTIELPPPSHRNFDA